MTRAGWILTASILAAVGVTTVLLAGRDRRDGAAPRGDPALAESRSGPFEPLLDSFGVADDAARTEVAERGEESRPSARERRAADEPSDRETVHVRLRGRVVDEEGVGIASAEVRAGDQDGGLLATSGPGGWIDAPIDFTGELARRVGLVHDMRGGDVVILAEGRAGAESWLDVEEGDVHLGTIVLGPGVVVSGSVLDDAGVSASHVHVAWLPRSVFPDDPELARREGLWAGQGVFAPYTVSDEDGRFHLRGVPVAPGFLKGEGPGIELGWTDVFDPGPAGTDGAVLTLERTGETWPIAGVLLGPDGRPVAHAEVRCYETRFRRFTETTDEEGRFTFHVAGEEPRRLEAEDPRGRAYPARAEVPPGTTGLVLRFGAPRWLEVAVTDPGGTPIPWSNVRCGSPDLVPGGEAGVARVLLPPEAFHVKAFAPGYLDGSFGPFDPATVGERIECALEPGPVVRGRVVHLGEPVRRARVGIHTTFDPGLVRSSVAPNPGDRPFAVRGSSRQGDHDATTDKEGAFLANLTESGWHLVRVEADGFPDTVRGPFEWSHEEGAEDLLIELEEGGSITGRVLVPPGAAGAGRVVGVSNGWGVAYTRTVDEDGRYRFDDLQPGAWQVRPCIPPVTAVVPLRYNPRRESAGGDPVWDCRVTAGGVTTFDLDLSDEGSYVIEGRLHLGEAGLEGWMAAVHPAHSFGWFGSAAIASDVLDEEGRFRMGLSRGGGYLLQLYRPGYAAFLLDPIEMSAGTNVWDRTIGTATLRVRGDEPENARFRQVWYRWVGDDGLAFFSATNLDGLAEGGVVFEHVPLGSGSICDPTEQLYRSGPLDPDAWEPLLTVVVQEDAEVVLQLP